MKLQLVVDNTPHRETAQGSPMAELAYFDSVIEHTRTQLLADLEYYRGKIADIIELDPDDRTGLISLYRAHEHHLGCLLGMINDAQAVD